MKGKKMILTAIAVGYLTGDYCSYAEISKNAFERNVLSFITFCSVILLFYVINETKVYIQGKRSDKESKAQRKHITFHNCEEERKIEEFKQERKEFFDNYFNQSSINMKTIK